MVEKLDVKGLVCPEPVMMLHARVRECAPGTELEITATDPTTRRDIPKFCQFLGHTLLSEESSGEEIVFRIRLKES